MSHPIEEPPPRTTVRKNADVDHGPVWHVRYLCGCPDNRFRTWHIAVIFATAHRCPKPWPGERA